MFDCAHICRLLGHPLQNDFRMPLIHETVQPFTKADRCIADLRAQLAEAKEALAEAAPMAELSTAQEEAAALKVSTENVHRLSWLIRK